MDEIQYASGRDLAIRNVDRDSNLRFAAVPWASRCIQCQDADGRDGLERTAFVREILVDAA